MFKEFEIQTSARAAFEDITGEINQIVRESGVQSGLCVIYVPHTTAGLTINENADPHVVQDILMELDKRIPWRDGYSHLEGNSAAHIKAALLGFQQSILIEQGALWLGAWQGVYLAEFDGPRRRRVGVKILRDAG